MLTAVLTNWVVAILVELSLDAGVGAVGAPVKVGLAKGALSFNWDNWDNWDWILDVVPLKYPNSVGETFWLM